MSVDIAELADARRELQLLRRQKQLRDKNGLAFYEPHHKQELFHKAPFRRRYLRTGNRFGKSDCGAAEDCAWALGERVWFSKDDPGRYQGIPKRPTKGLIIAQDWDKTNEIFTSMEAGERRGKIFRFLPASVIKKVSRNHSGNVDKITVESIHGGDSIIYFDTVKAFKQNPMGAESSDWDWIHVDEPCPIDMWRAVSRGLVDRDGWAWFTCTPLTEMWINDYFIPSSRTRDLFDEPETFDYKWVITGSMHDNPHLTPAAIKIFEEELTAEERTCRISGIPMAMSGLIYKNFDRERHVLMEPPVGWEDWTEVPDDWSIRISIDPHPRTPHAVLFAATSPSDITVFFAELFKPGLISNLCDTIKEILAGRQLAQAICDPIAWIPNPATGLTMADQFYQNGIPIVKASKELEYGILKTQEALSRDDFLYFNCNLRETLWEFDRYMWKDDKEKPEDKDDHLMECLYRLVLGGLKHVDMSQVDRKSIKPMDVDRHAKTVLPPVRRSLQDWNPTARRGGLTINQYKTRRYPK